MVLVIVTVCTVLFQKLRKAKGMQFFLQNVRDKYFPDFENV